MTKASLTDPIISAHTIPRKFPVKSENINYPRIDKKGVDNPLYYTTSSAIGSDVPRPHQLAERYFPKSNEFSQSFANRTRRFAGMKTHVSYSHVHRELDRFY